MHGPIRKSEVLCLPTLLCASTLHMLFLLLLTYLHLLLVFLEDFSFLPIEIGGRLRDVKPEEGSDPLELEL